MTQHNLVFLWGETRLNESDVAKIKLAAERPELKITTVRVFSVAEAEKELRRYHPYQYFHKGQPPMSIYNFLGGTRLEEIKSE